MRFSALRARLSGPGGQCPGRPWSDPGCGCPGRTAGLAGRAIEGGPGPLDHPGDRIPAGPAGLPGPVVDQQPLAVGSRFVPQVPVQAEGGAHPVDRLTEDGPDSTILKYEAKADVGGKIAQLGSRLITSTSKKLAGEFFSTFGKKVGG